MYKKIKIAGQTSNLYASENAWAIKGASPG